MIGIPIYDFALRAKVMGEDLVATPYIGRQPLNDSRLYWPREKVTLSTSDSYSCKLNILNLRSTRGQYGNPEEPSGSRFPHLERSVQRH
jgi:hypothetical protein